MSSHSLDVLSALSPEVPPALVALADGWGPRSTPAVPRLAASVVLCRDAPDGLQTYLLHRHARMAFAASMAVFPGGGVDPSDGPDPIAGTTQRLLACAIRETREETGVELATRDLVPWAHWITPELQPIRYDTYFYLAALPQNQTAADLSTETERAAWARPADAIAAYRAETLAMMPPTLSILIELAELGSVCQAIDLGRDRVIETVLPEVVRIDAAEGPGESAGAGVSGRKSRPDETPRWVFRYPAPTRSATG